MFDINEAPVFSILTPLAPYPFFPPACATGSQQSAAGGSTARVSWGERD